MNTHPDTINATGILLMDVVCLTPFFSPLLPVGKEPAFHELDTGSGDLNP